MPDVITRLNAALDGHYRIERQLGEGGMATVYLAEDLRHERKVALKVLKPELAAVVGAERFLAEIKTTANLQHPHILPLFDSGEADSFLFYVMPYLEGESLRERLDREHQLPVDEAVQIARNVAEALDYAHSRGVVHRDIKPANILLQAGKPVVSDFGIALVVGEAGGGRLTQTGVSLGSPHYMSPEQAAAEKELDGRSDLYSLGCVVYEMLVGEPPFTGQTAQAVITKRFVQDPPDVASLRSGVPAAVASAVGKSLSRAAGDRFATGASLARALDIVSGLARSEGPSASTGKSIAVLPFENMSPDAENQYFADGIAEELLNLLTTIPELRVVSRSSAFSFKGSGLQLSEVAQRLNVDHVLEGSVRKAGNRVRITAQLIEATSDSHLWSQTFDRTLDDIFAIQDEIAGAVVNHLKASLLGQMPTIQETDPAAYALFLQARHLVSQLTPEAAREADDLYRQVLHIAPDYAPAWTGSAVNHMNMRWFAGVDYDDAYRLARQAVTHALKLDPNDAVAHSVQGTISMARDHDFAAAARYYERALELAPNGYDILQQAALFAAVVGRPHSALAVFEHLARREPLNPITHGFLAWVALSANRPQDAIAPARTAMRLSPMQADIRCALGWGLLLTGHPQEAVATIEEEPNPHIRLALLAIAYHEAGDGARSESTLADLISKYGETNPFMVAIASAWRGDSDRTLESLERAAEFGDPNFHELLFVRWGFRKVEEDPRWLPFLERHGMAPGQVGPIDFEIPLSSARPSSASSREA